MSNFGRKNFIYLGFLFVYNVDGSFCRGFCILFKVIEKVGGVVIVIMEVGEFVEYSVFVVYEVSIFEDCYDIIGVEFFEVDRDVEIDFDVYKNMDVIIVEIDVGGNILIFISVYR